jgi:hypothetical protein
LRGELQLRVLRDLRAFCPGTSKVSEVRLRLRVLSRPCLKSSSPASAECGGVTGVYGEVLSEVYL